MKARTTIYLTLAALLAAFPAAHALEELFEARGYDVSQIDLPEDKEVFPIKALEGVNFEKIADLDFFPEGPSYRPSDGSYFFSGNQGLSRVDAEGKIHYLLKQPKGGGTHPLPDGSILLIGPMGLKRVFPDGRIELVADGSEAGDGNDLSVGRYREVYFSIPSIGIFRVGPGKEGRFEKVVDQGCNGLEVDPAGEYLYTVRRSVDRYKISGAEEPLGEVESLFKMPQGMGGGDGCTFDAWGNLYTMKFGTGEIRVIDLDKKEIIATIPVGVAPATNMTFGGAGNRELFVTAGVPRVKNMQVLSAKLGVTGFCGHVGATEYPVVRVLDERVDPEAFGLLPVDDTETE